MLDGNMFVVSYGALWILTLVLYGAVFLLYRHHGSQLLSHECSGPKVGKPVSLDLTTLDGETYGIGKGSHAAPHLIVFGQPNCRFCDELRQSLSAVSGVDIRVVVVYSADEQRTRSYVESFASRVITVADPGSKIARLWNVQKMPHFVVVDSLGTVRNSGGMRGPDSLKIFLEAARQANLTRGEAIALSPVS